MYKPNFKTSQDQVTIGYMGVLTTLRAYIEHSKIGETLIIKGKITSQELKDALIAQKETRKPLGQILVAQNKITYTELAGLLIKQKTVRFAAAIMLYAASFGIFTKKSNAENIKDIPAKLILAAASPDDYKKIKTYPALFGASEKRSDNLTAFTKWTDMFKRFDTDLSTPEYQGIVHDLKAELSDYKSESIYDMADSVNAMMNKQKYIIDNKNWGKSDYWATPIEFLSRGGDCEDFAIAKYVALRALGVPENRMRIAIVQDEQKNMPHAVLIVYSEKGMQVLDNQIKDMRSTTEISHYKPIFSINQESWWLHTSPEPPNTIVASAE